MTPLSLDGLVLHVPAGVEAVSAPATGLREWRNGGLPPADSFAAALEDTGADVVFLDVLREREGLDGSEPVVIEVEGEDPVALLEDRDGVLSWRVEPHSRRWVVDRGFRRWRGWLLRLVNPPAAGGLAAMVKALEGPPRLRQVMRPGDCTRSDLEDAWPVLGSARDIDGLPLDRQPKVLVWVHGAFSDTIGDFGDLPRSQGGRQAVQAMLNGYDAVVAMDHPTLSANPATNARQLLRLLRGRQWPHGLHLDLVSCSRGTLVARSLVERVTTEQPDLQLSFDKVFMLAPAAGGTLLADPEKWGFWLDHTTNLVRAACESGQRLFPAAVGALEVASHRLKRVFDFLQSLAWGVHGPRVVPGLVALHPRSEFLQWLNSTPLPRNLPEVDSYAWVRSDFEHQAPSVLPPESVSMLLQRLDIAVDAPLGGRASDLVVDHEHSLKGHHALASRWKALKEYPSNNDVHHFNYWLFPQTRKALLDGLGIGTNNPDFLAGLAGLGEEGLRLRLFGNRAWSALLAPTTDTLLDPRGTRALWRNELVRSIVGEGVRGGLGPRKRGAVLPELLDPYAEGVQVGGVPYSALFDLDLKRLYGPHIGETRARDLAVEAFHGSGTARILAQLDDAQPPQVRRSTLVVVPGLPGAHLALSQGEERGRRVWFSLAQFLRGNLAETATLAPNGEGPAEGAERLVADGLLWLSYGKAICAWRASGHRVSPFAYDWRKPLTAAADALGAHLRALSEQGHKDIVLVCHSTGGVVASLWAARHADDLDVVRRAVFVGVPLAGTFQALALLSGASSLLGLISAASTRDPHRQIVQMASSWHGPVDLLPDGERFSGPDCLAASSWSQASRPTDAALAHGRQVLAAVHQSPLLARTHVIVGTNRDTVIEAVSTPLRPGTLRRHMGPGDSAVPLESALHPSLSTVHVVNSRPHATLFNDPSVILATSQLAERGSSQAVPASDPEQVREAARTALRRSRVTQDLGALAQKMLVGAATADDILSVF